VALEVGSLVLVQHDPYGVSYLRWSFAGHKGKVTQIAPRRTTRLSTTSDEKAKTLSCHSGSHSGLR
jgi:hypothetical protein